MKLIPGDILRFGSMGLTYELVIESPPQVSPASAWSGGGGGRWTGACVQSWSQVQPQGALCNPTPNTGSIATRLHPGPVLVPFGGGGVSAPPGGHFLELHELFRRGWKQLGGFDTEMGASLPGCSARLLLSDPARILRRTESFLWHLILRGYIYKL